MAESSRKKGSVQSTDNNGQTPPSSSSSAIWKCHMCNLSVRSEVKWRDHIKRKRHRKLFKKQCRGKKNNAKKDARLGNLFSCELCGIRCDTETSLLEHYNGKKHKTNEARDKGNGGGDVNKGDKGNDDTVGNEGLDFGDSQEKTKGDKGKGIAISDTHEKAKGSINAKGMEDDHLQQFLTYKHDVHVSKTESCMQSDAKGDDNIQWCPQCKVMFDLTELKEHMVGQDHKARAAKP